MQNLAPPTGTDEQLNHRWELLRVLAGLFENRKQSGRQARTSLQEMLVRRLHPRNVFSEWAEHQLRQYSLAQHRPLAHHSTAGKKTTKTDFWGARAIFFLSGRDSSVSCTGEVSLGTYRCPKIFKRRACVRPPTKVFWASWWVWGGGAHCAQADSSTTKKTDSLLTWRPLLVKKSI